MSTPKPAFLVIEDVDGDKHVECPHCTTHGTIVEVDSAIRWNTLNFDGDRVTASLGPEGDWDFERWLCTGCMSSEISAPEGFEIVDWT